MKAFQKFVQLSLVLVIFLTSMGFRVNLEECRGHKEKQISFFGAPDCCCEKKSKKQIPTKDTCGDFTCIMQGNNQSQLNFNSGTELSAKALKAVSVYSVFEQNIRPVLQEKLPHYTLPPPRSGKNIIILYQTFII